MRTLVLLFAMLPALAIGQEPAEAVGPPKKATKDQVYKWVDKDGVVHYSSTPPTDNAKPAKLPPLQTFKGTAPQNLNKFAKPGAAGAPGAAAPGGAVSVEIVTPSREETFRGGERVVPVAVLVTPQLGAEQKLIYLLDGTPASPPTTDTSFAITGVERGAHTVSVTLVGEAGEQIATSNSVTFYMQPPQVDRANQGKPTTPPPKPPKPKPP